ncbi:TPR repeat-containing protein [Candidatus Thiomargarita nelsonii]|uniref:TPR repeat-containing protein n=1 Tax=Candidatus Thiomargarita nelsonii TaxID=1003181 RepID=A0A0A6P1J3_9GAMM|nr:TPR repeat-containing protein [Candidatus Thiomargarita nelsonii]
MRHFSQKLLLLLLIVLPLNSLASSLKDQLDYYIDKYKLADSSDERVRRVHQVFKKVSTVAEKRYNRPPQLAIVKGLNTPDEPLAMALPDGGIVLSKKAIDIIYENVSLAHGDTRAAFVLGHELAHLSKDDFWHREFLSIAKESPLLPQLVKNYQEQDGKQKEIEADDHGFIYAALAGYPVDKLLAEGTQQQNFLVYWQQQSFQEVSDTHPRPEYRAELLQARLQKLLGNLPYFHFGVRLTHFQRCEDAVYFFREFLKYFPGREVYNNLGVCELQRARKLLGKEAYLYWLPSVLDVTTQTENFSLPYASKGERNTLADEFLEKAKTYFELASSMDSSYVPAKVNLAITTLYLEKIYEARTAIEQAYELAPDDLDIQGMRAVILYEQGQQSPYIDMWPYVIQLLDELMQQSNIPPSVLYNMAQLLEQRKRTGAEEIWQQLGQRLAELPAPIRNIVCENVNCPAPQELGSAKAVFLLPVKFGVKAKRDKRLRKWRKSDVRLYKIYEQFYQEPKGATEVLALRGRVEMVVLKNLGNVTKDDLPAFCGQALRERRVVNGSLWSCQNWAALVVDGEVAEVWVVKSKR